MKYIEDIKDKYSIFGGGEIESAYLLKDDKYYYERVETKDGKVRIKRYGKDSLSIRGLVKNWDKSTQIP